MVLRIKYPNIKFSRPGLSLSRQGWESLLYKLSHSLPALLIAFAVFLVGLNVFSQVYYYRLDLTDNKSFSLSQSSKKIVRDLKDKVVIRTYYSNNLPPEMKQPSRDIHDLLREYERSSRGKLRLEISDPRAEDFVAKAQAAGITEVQFSELSADKFAIETGYAGIVIEQGEEKLNLPVVSSSENLEYEISSRLYKLSKQDKAKLVFIAGHGAKTPATAYQQLQIQLSNEFELVEIDITTEADKLQQYKLAIIAAPSEDLSEAELYALDQFLLAGGNLIVLAEQYSLTTTTGVPSLSRSKTNLYELTRHHGIQVNENTVLDQSNLPVGNGFSQIAYPFWVLTQQENIERKLPPLNNLGSIALFWPTSLSKNEQSTADFQTLLTTTKQAWELTGEQISANPIDIKVGQPKQYTLAALSSGTHTSYFNEKELARAKQNHKSSSDQGRLLVIADSDFVVDNYIQGSEQNPSLILNLSSWLTGQGGLDEIRAKNIKTRPLKVTTSTQKNLIRFATTGLAPVGFILIGIVYNLYRSRRRSLTFGKKIK